MTTKHYARTSDGVYLGGWNDGNPLAPTAETEVATPPESAYQIWDGTSWVCPQDLLLGALSTYRYEKETSGIATITTSTTFYVDTSDRSKVLINGAYNKVKQDATPAATMAFKTGTGWVNMAHSDVEALALELADHVRKCFEAEETVAALITNSTLTTRSAVEAQFDTEYAAL